MDIKDKKDKTEALNINNRNSDSGKEKSYPYCWDIDDNVFNGYSKNTDFKS